MSKLGIGLLYFALAGALVAGVFGYLEIDKLNTTKATLVQTEDAKTKSDKAAADAKAEALKAQQETADKQKSLDAATAKVTDVTKQMEDANKAAEDAKTALNDAKTKADKAQADLDTINKQLDGHTVQEFADAKDKALKDLAALQDEQKILQDTVQARNKEVADLKDAFKRSEKGEQPPGITGKVTWVNRTWNFVVLDVGLSSGVVPNGELIVYRKNAFLGKVKVTSVDTNSAVADILPDAKGDIQVGDYVLN